MVINLSCAILTGASLFETVLLIVSANFPDRIEWSLQIEHRKMGHWWVIYALGSLLCTCSENVVWKALCVFSLGCLIHILCDFLTPYGIPGVDPEKRHSIQLYTTGSITENLLAIIVLITSVILNGKRWLIQIIA